MNQHLISKIAQQLRDVASGVISPGKLGIQNFQMHDSVAYSLTNDASITFNEVVGQILKKNNYSKKFSAKYLEKMLKSLFAKLLSDESLDLEKELGALIVELDKFNQSNVIFLKIEGLILSTCFELGLVRFVPGDEYLLDSIKEKSSEILKSTKNDDESKSAFQQMIAQQSESEFRGGCVGVVEVNAEPIRAFEIAKEEVRRAIDLLRFASKAIYPLKEDIRIGLKGEHPKSTRQGFIFSESEFNTKGDTIGSVRPFEVNQESLKRMDEIGVFSISSALSKKQTNNLEEALIRSIHWFSVALTQNENGNAFLFLIVALESLFKAESGNSIGGTVAESVAFLMSDNREGRKNIISLVREYYGKRSGVAHGGKKSISDTDLYTLINIVGTTIKVSIEKLSEFDSQKQLMGWIEDMKLS